MTQGHAVEFSQPVVSQAHQRPSSGPAECYAAKLRDGVTRLALTAHPRQQNYVRRSGNKRTSEATNTKDDIVATPGQKSKIPEGANTVHAGGKRGEQPSPGPQRTQRERQDNPSAWGTVNPVRGTRRRSGGPASHMSPRRRCRRYLGHRARLRSARRFVLPVGG